MGVGQHCSELAGVSTGPERWSLQVAWGDRLLGKRGVMRLRV